MWVCECLKGKNFSIRFVFNAEHLEIRDRDTERSGQRERYGKETVIELVSERASKREEKNTFELKQ